MKEWIIANGLTRREFVKASLAGTAALAFSSSGFPLSVSAQGQGPSNCRPFRTRKMPWHPSFRPGRLASTTENITGAMQTT
jgi:anaerobic selenocysteine-containing dehydrogenase